MSRFDLWINAGQGKKHKYSQNSEGNDEFTKKLIKVAKKIISEAKGRTCGDCFFYNLNGFCEKHIFLLTESALICSKTSVACSTHTPKTLLNTPKSEKRLNHEKINISNLIY